MLLCTGCSGLLSSPEYHEPKTYDLGIPEVRQALPFSLLIRPFTSDTSARYKMLFRKGERLIPDEFARWSRTPSEMLTRYCRIAFSRSTDHAAGRDGVPHPEFVLTGTVLSFETDVTAKISRLFVKCVLCDTENDFRIFWAKTYFITVPAAISEKEPGQGAAVAMRQAVENFVRDLDQDLSGLSLPSAGGKELSPKGK